MTEVDREWLTDMLERSRLAVSILGSRSVAEVQADVTTLYAISYAVQIIGEAANHVSPEGQADFPDIPWSKIIGMRNRLVHAYDTAQTAIIVETVREHLPALIDSLEKARVEDDTP
jgi:uncharacterized protein with HEPN domain